MQVVSRANTRNAKTLFQRKRQGPNKMCIVSPGLLAPDFLPPARWSSDVTVYTYYLPVVPTPL